MTLSLTIKPVLFSTVGVVSMASLISPALAADQVELTYQTTTVIISTDEIKNFADTGTVPTDLQVFFDETAQVPANIRTLLTNVIRIPKFVESFLDSPTGEFALLQLDQAVSSSSSEDIDSLRTAVAAAGSDRDISVLEILEAYPEPDVRLNLTELEGTYNRVNNFIVNVQPAIDTAIGFLQDIVCDCETETTATLEEDVPGEEVPGENVPGEDAQSVNPSTPTAATSQSKNCQDTRLTEGLFETRPVNQNSAEVEEQAQATSSAVESEAIEAEGEM